MSRRNDRSAAAVFGAVDEIELVIEKLVAGGDGLGRYQGVPVFVPRSAPGDRVRVQIVERRPQYGRGEIVELETPGPGRRTAPCGYFERCGGCDLQHLEDDVQVELKVAAARESLERLGRLELPGQQRVISGDAWGYRLRTQLQIEPGEEQAGLGYFARRSHDLVAVDRCPVLVPELEALLPVLPAQLAGSSIRRLDLAADGERIASAPVVADLPRDELRLRVGEFDYAFDARTFFQGHRGLLTKLVDAVLGPAVEGGTAVDLYAGVGLFSLPLGRRHDRVIAVEGDRIAARYLRKNVRANRATNVEAENRSVDGWLAELPENVAEVILDPPRVGLTAQARQALRDRRPARLTYVSCHPAALARDLAVLCRDYRLEELIFLDLFPQTAHLEVVARLTRP